MKRGILPTGLLLGLTLLAGCMPFARHDTVRILAPEPTVAADPDWPRVEEPLLVQRPIADQTRGSTRIVVRLDGSRLAFYPGVAWLDVLPEMLQAELIRAFTDSDRLPAVTRPGTARGHYALATEVRRFDAVEAARRTLTVELEIQATLLEVRSGAPLATRTFRSSTPVEGRDVDALAAAFETALARLQSELIGWTLRAVPAS